LYNILLAFVLLLIGMYSLVIAKNIIMSLISFNVIQAAVIMLFLDITSLDKSEVPIILHHVHDMVDPLPQAMMLTTIVVGSAITALILMMSIKIFHYFGTLDWKEIIERNI